MATLGALAQIVKSEQQGSSASLDPKRSSRDVSRIAGISMKIRGDLQAERKASQSMNADQASQILRGAMGGLQDEDSDDDDSRMVMKMSDFERSLAAFAPMSDAFTKLFKIVHNHGMLLQELKSTLTHVETRVTSQQVQLSSLNDQLDDVLNESSDEEDAAGGMTLRQRMRRLEQQLKDSKKEIDKANRVAEDAASIGKREMASVEARLRDSQDQFKASLQDSTNEVTYRLGKMETEVESINASGPSSLGASLAATKQEAVNEVFTRLERAVARNTDKARAALPKDHVPGATVAAAASSRSLKPGPSGASEEEVRGEQSGAGGRSQHEASSKPATPQHSVASVSGPEGPQASGINSEGSGGAALGSPRPQPSKASAPALVDGLDSKLDRVVESLTRLMSVSGPATQRMRVDITTLAERLRTLEATTISYKETAVASSTLETRVQETVHGLVDKVEALRRQVGKKAAVQAFLQGLYINSQANKMRRQMEQEGRIGPDGNLIPTASMRSGAVDAAVGDSAPGSRPMSGRPGSSTIRGLNSLSSDALFGHIQDIYTQLAEKVDRAEMEAWLRQSVDYVLYTLNKSSGSGALLDSSPEASPERRRGQGSPPPSAGGYYTGELRDEILGRNRSPQTAGLRGVPKSPVSAQQGYITRGNATASPADQGWKRVSNTPQPGPESGIGFTVRSVPNQGQQSKRLPALDVPPGPGPQGAASSPSQLVRVSARGKRTVAGSGGPAHPAAPAPAAAPMTPPLTATASFGAGGGASMDHFPPAAADSEIVLDGAGAVDHEGGETVSEGDPGTLNVSRD